MPLFEVAITEDAKIVQGDVVEEEKLVFGPTAIVAKDGQTAAMIVVLDNKVTVDRNRMRVWIRPFA